jgi:FkbM family methyltransferase
LVASKNRIQTIRFFSSETNKKRIEKVASWLADEESKKTYKAMLAHRRKRITQTQFPFHGRETQYFTNNFFHYGNEEVLIDCGAFIGDTIDSFMSKVPNYAKIYSFEPDPNQFEILKSKHGDNPKIQLIHAGVSDKEATLFFDAQGAGSSRLDQGGGLNRIPVKVQSIDELSIKENVTFSKMDVEGAEWDTLHGAKQIILRDKPKLAICIYHSDEDMIRLAEYIHELVPEYQLYVRHHEPWPIQWETVLYAILPEVVS